MHDTRMKKNYEEAKDELVHSKFIDHQAKTSEELEAILLYLFQITRKVSTV